MVKMTILCLKIIEMVDICTKWCYTIRWKSMQFSQMWI